MFATPRSYPPLRIALVTETYPPEINGVAHTLRQLVMGLKQRGHQVALIRPRQAVDTTAGADELLVLGLPLPGYRGLRFGVPRPRQLPQFWHQWRPDVVYIATQGPLGRVALTLARAQSTPALTGFHTQFHQYSRYYGVGLLMRPIMHSLRRFHNRSAGTLVPTTALQAQLTAAGFHNVGLMTRGVDTALFTPQRRSSQLRATWQCDADDLAVLYVGRIAAEKNIALVFATFDALAAVQPRCRLIMVGDGPERVHWQRRYPQAWFAGAKIGEELAAHYASADVFLFPSVTETFGNVVPEAMASGLAVVAFDDAAAHEHIRSGYNGLTVPLNDVASYSAAAVALAQSPAQVTALGQAARATAATLSWEHVVISLEQQFYALHQRRSQ